MARYRVRLGVLVVLFLLIGAIPVASAIGGRPPAGPPLASPAAAPGAVEEILTLTNQHGVSNLAYSPDGATLATVGRGATVWLRDADDRYAEPIILPQSDPAGPGTFGDHFPASYSPDGSVFAVGRADGSVQLWDLTRPGDEPQLLRIHMEAVRDLAFSPDGTILATGSWDETIRLSDLPDPDATETIIRAGSLVIGIAISPDGSLVAAGLSDHSVRIWRLDQPDADPVVLEGHEGEVHHVAFSPGGALLASGSDDHTVRIWDLADLDAAPRVLQAEEQIDTLAFSPDGTTVAAGGSLGGPWYPYAVIWLWDLENSGSAPKTIELNLFSLVAGVAWRPNTATLAVAAYGGTVRLIDTTRVDAKPTTFDYPDAMPVALDPAATTLVAGGPHGELWFWNFDQQDDIPREINAHEGQVTAVEYSPDGRWFASAGFDEGLTGAATVRLRAPADLGAEPLELSVEWPVSSLAFSPDSSTLAVALWDETVRLWDLTRPGSAPTTLVTETDKRGGDTVQSLAYSPDGRRLAGGGGDGPVFIWDLDQPGQEPLLLTHEHEDTSYTEALWSIAFSPDGQTVVAVGQAGHLLAWDVSGLRPRSIDVALPEAPTQPTRRTREYGYTFVAFSPGGESLFVSGVDAAGAAVLYRWDTGNLTAAPVDLAAGQAIGFPIAEIVFRPDGHTLTTASFGGSVHRWTLELAPATPGGVAR